MLQPTVAIIVVAAGSGTRLGATEPKAFVDLGGMTILERALRSVFTSAEQAQVVVVAPSSHFVTAESIVERLGSDATVVEGGSTRQGSVAAGLGVLEPSILTVLVHDAARALTPGAVFDRVIARVRETGEGVIPTLPVSDTIKRVADARAIETVDRSELVHVQTPQAFPRAALDAAYASATREYTDDAALFSEAGHAVQVVPGDALSFKITTPWDLRRAEELLGASTETSTEMSIDIRTGVGIDVHAYDESQPLWLGGLLWPGEPGLAGHSDGDALSHAICDALLSAAGLGDIGGIFGTDDPRLSGAHGDVFIAETVALVRGAGFAIGNVSVQVVAQHPRLGPRRDQLQQHLGALVGAPVSVSATTTDGLGFTGRGEGVAVIANALVRRAG